MYQASSTEINLSTANVCQTERQLAHNAILPYSSQLHYDGFLLYILKFNLKN